MLSRLLGMILIVAVVPSAAMSARLDGLRSVSIAVEDPSPDLLNRGVTVEKVTQVVRERLISNGVTVDDDSGSALYFRVTGFKPETSITTFLFCIELDLMERVVPTRNIEKKLAEAGKAGTPSVTALGEALVSGAYYGASWDAPSVLGIAPLDEVWPTVRFNLDRITDIFLIDYLAANREE